MGPGSMGPMGGAPFGPASGQYMPNVSRPAMTSVANPPIVANNMQYGPSYKMQYAKRSTADKTAVKYTGFLPLEGRRYSVRSFKMQIKRTPSVLLERLPSET